MVLTDWAKSKHIDLATDLVEPWGRGVNKNFVPHYVMYITPTPSDETKEIQLYFEKNTMNYMIEEVCGAVGASRNLLSPTKAKEFLADYIKQLPKAEAKHYKEVSTYLNKFGKKFMLIEDKPYINNVKKIVKKLLEEGNYRPDFFNFL